MNPPLKVQLAFQGGGAKIVALLAAAEAIQQLEKKGTVKVTRLAGTSAGAIVAAFLAAELSITDIRDRLAGESGKNLIGRFPSKSKLAALSDVFFGKRFWNDEPLAKWLETEFRQVRQFSDLKKNLFVYSANLEAGGAEVQIASDLITALLESAGLPFCFRTWRSGGNTLNVDGGLCQNLPVNDLMADTSHGRVLAFSFPSARPGRPKGLLKFCMSLLDVAIGHSVESARLRLGAASVCNLKIPPDLTTFNFEKGLKYLASRDYSETKEGVLDWFDQIISSSVSQSKAHFNHDIWRKPEKEDFHSEMQKVGRIYQKLSVHQKLRYNVVKFMVVGNCLAGGRTTSSRPDEVFYSLDFEPLGEPLTLHHLTLSSPQTSEFFGQYSLDFMNASTQAELPFEVLASISPQSETDRELIVFFLPPLKSGSGAYRLSLQDQGIDFLAGLVDSEKRTDYLEVSLRYAQENIGLLQIAIQVPTVLGQVYVAPQAGLTGLQMTKPELDAAFGKPELGFSAFGWQGKDLAPKKIRIDFSR